MHTIYLSHNGMTEPLGYSQVLPYVRGLATHGFHIDLLACEPPGTAQEQLAPLVADLARSGVCYTPLLRRPSSGLLDKGRDCVELLLSGLQRVRRHLRLPRVVHARGHLPSAVANGLCALLPGARFIFDFRGLVPEEYLVLGNWTPADLRYRLTVAMQDRLLVRADRVVVLTESLREALCAPGGVLHRQEDKVVVVPCCVDTERFRPDPVQRARRRAALGVPDGAPLLVFSGSLKRYDFDATLRLLHALRRQADVHLLLLTQDDPTELGAQMAGAGHGAAFHRVAAPPREVPGWLAAADLAVALLRQDRTAIAVSPTKIAEYLAVGLPTALTAGAGDNDRLLGDGLLRTALDDQALARTARQMLEALADTEAARRAARQTALRHFSLARIGVPRYRALYEQLA